MSRAYKTVERALKAFLVEAPKKYSKREYSRRYEVAGVRCQIVKTYGPRNKPPRFKWVEPAPEKYAGLDITEYIRYSYLRPYAKPNPPPEKPPEDMLAKPLQFVNGVAIHATDTDHYRKLLNRLEKKELFDICEE